MSTHEDLIREARERVQAWIAVYEKNSAWGDRTGLSYESAPLLLSDIRALASAPSLSVQSEEALQDELDRHEYAGNNLCECGDSMGGSTDGVAWTIETNAHLARALIQSGAVRVAPSLVAASREAVIESVVRVLHPKATWHFHLAQNYAVAVTDALLAPGGPVRVVEVTAEQAWVSALEHVWELNDPAYSILPDTASRLPLVTEADVRQAKAENPYVGNSRKEQTGGE